MCDFGIMGFMVLILSGFGLTFLGHLCGKLSGYDLGYSAGIKERHEVKNMKETKEQ